MEANARKRFSPKVSDFADGEFQISNEEALNRKVKQLEQQLSENDAKVRVLEEELLRSQEEARLVEIYKRRLNHSIRECDGIRVELANYIGTLADVKKAKLEAENDALGYKMYFRQMKDMYEKLEESFVAAQEKHDKKVKLLNAEIESLRKELEFCKFCNRTQPQSQANCSRVGKKAMTRTSDILLKPLKFSSTLGSIQEVEEEFRVKPNHRQGGNKKLNSPPKNDPKGQGFASKTREQLEKSPPNQLTSVKGQRERVDKISAKRRFRHSISKWLSMARN